MDGNLSLHSFAALEKKDQRTNLFFTELVNPLTRAEHFDQTGFGSLRLNDAIRVYLNVAFNPFSRD